MSEAATRASCAKCRGSRTGNHVSYCIECYRAYKRAWYQKNRDTERARCAAYNKRNPHVPAAAMRRHREKYPERAARLQREYRTASPEKFRMWDRERRVKRKAQINATVDKITAKQWSDINAAFQHHCVYCLKPFARLTMDHIIPLSRGGDHTAANIVPACSRCNSSKNARHHLDFVARKFGRLV